PFGVVRPLHQDGAAAVAVHPVLRRVEAYVVDRAVFRTAAAADGALDDDVVGDVDVHRGVERLAALGEHAFEGLCLRHSAREAVEQETLLGVGFLQTLLDHLDDQIVRYELAAVGEALEALSELGAIADGSANQVAGGNGWDAPHRRNVFRLRAFARTG